MIYEARLKAQRDEYSRIQGARREGLDEGRREGLDEGRREGQREGRREGRREGQREGELKGRQEVARNLKRMGIPVEHITQGTGLSPEDIAKL
jgi:predicted transposase YdaD